MQQELLRHYTVTVTYFCICMCVCVATFACILSRTPETMQWTNSLLNAASPVSEHLIIWPRNQRSLSPHSRFDGCVKESGRQVVFKLLKDVHSPELRRELMGVREGYWNNMEDVYLWMAAKRSSVVRGRVGVTMSLETSPLMLGVCGEFDALDSNTSPERCMNPKWILTALKACSSEVLTHIVAYGEGKQPLTAIYTAHIARIPEMAQTLSDWKTCCIYTNWVDCVSDKHVPHILEGGNWCMETMYVCHKWK